MFEKYAARKDNMYDVKAESARKNWGATARKMSTEEKAKAQNEYQKYLRTEDDKYLKQRNVARVKDLERQRREDIAFRKRKFKAVKRGENFIKQPGDLGAKAKSIASKGETKGLGRILSYIARHKKGLGAGVLGLGALGAGADYAFGGRKPENATYY